ncbi:universal stress protein [Tumidithrix elongata RA019]|uniref:Universal stress protein n=1 Tax=Tumidithrix elongata BACA0141 TaxID=2716417 RepID=A0AAW9PWM0_9CYAN|nr:universal stress protein [Tumidithrix elongata RA019]
MTLSKTPEINLCQVFEPDNTEPDTTILEKAADFLKQRFNGYMTMTSIHASSISDAILECARKNHSEAIILGASQEGMLQQVMHGNIPASISKSSEQTVILVRGYL